MLQGIIVSSMTSCCQHRKRNRKHLQCRNTEKFLAPEAGTHFTCSHCMQMCVFQIAYIIVHLMLSLRFVTLYWFLSGHMQSPNLVWLCYPAGEPKQDRSQSLNFTSSISASAGIQPCSEHASQAKHVLQRALFEVHRRLLEGDHSMTAGSTAPVVTRFLVNQSQANNLLQRSENTPP